MFELHTYSGGIAQTNNYLLQPLSGAPAILFDASEGVTDWLGERGQSPAALVLTHAHFDHVMDAARVHSTFGCPIHAFAQPDEGLTLAGLLNAMGMAMEVASYEVDHLLEGETECAAAGIRLDLFHVPGHSPDSLCFRPRERDHRDREILIGGDVLFQRGIGRTDFPHSDHETLLRGIREKLYVLDGDTVVYPGHGPATTIGEEKRENPFVTGT